MQKKVIASFSAFIITAIVALSMLLVGVSAANNATACIVDASGDMFMVGIPGGLDKWPVELEDPLQPDHSLVSLKVGPGAVATSTVTKRTWNQAGIKRHHIIDPRTNEPAVSLRYFRVSGAIPDGLLVGIVRLAKSGKQAPAGRNAVQCNQQKPRTSGIASKNMKTPGQDDLTRRFIFLGYQFGFPSRSTGMVCLGAPPSLGRTGWLSRYCWSREGASGWSSCRA